jgi:hypothetical protein
VGRGLGMSFIDDTMIDNIPEGGQCTYCQRFGESCEGGDSLGGCKHFFKKDIIETIKYSYLLKGEPVKIGGVIKYIQPNENHTNLEVREFGEFECIRCGGITILPQTSGKFVKPFECSNDVCGRRGPFKVLFDKSILNPPWKLPTGIIETDPRNLYDVILEFLKNSIYLLDDMQYVIFTLWLMASWISESFNTCAYLLYIAPKDSGKTRGLDIISELGYRVIPSISFSSASMFRSLDMWHGTLLIDEAEYQINPKTEKGSDLYGILNGGYKRGFPANRLEKEGDFWVPTNFDIFGFKAIAATRSFNPTLESRSIIFNMEQHSIKNIILPSEQCEDIRNRLLYFRFVTLGKLKLVLPKQLEKGRIIEIFHPIYSVANLINPDLLPDLDSYILNIYMRNKAEDKVSMVEVDILRAMDELFDNLKNSTMTVFVKDILSRIEYDWPDYNNQKVGYKLKDMGFIREKNRAGSYIPMANEYNKKKFDQYKERYSL